ncbi:MAG TPA: NfeD family protein [Ilumatobacteraceae bacterium]|nr:NfeD family protein [Ilumatobacteraceae bacterium]
MAGLTLFGPAVQAQSDDNDPAEPIDSADVGRVDVLQVSGFVDPILVDAISDAIERASDGDAQALILQVNSDATVVDDDTVGDLLVEVANAPIPIGIWVGPSGSRFYGTAAQLLAVADVTGMSPGSRVGYIGVPLDPPGLPDGVSVDFGIAEERLRNGSVGLSDARTLDVFKQRIDDDGIPTISNMLQAMDGYEENGVRLVTTQLVVLDDGSTRFDTVSIVRFQKLSLVDQLFHTVASPPVAYLLLLIGLALLVFEFFTAGVGLAGGIGAISTVLAFTGLAVLPTNTWAVVLIGLAMLAFAVDVQVGIPRFWTGVGIVLTIVGSWFLFEPVPGSSMRPGWLALIAGIGGIVLTFIVGMPSMVRTRFATPTVGREWMIGKEGTAVGPIDPDGIVEVDGARWRARTNRATPLEAGAPLRVAAIDGVTLDVEPLEGAARDYREMRTKNDTAAPVDAEAVDAEP